MLLDGLTWRVGSGTNIKVWRDKWVVSQNKAICPTSRIQDVNMELMVSDLINGDTARWKTDLIHSYFDEETADNILAIPISDINQSDTLYWAYSKNGVNTVRSAYWFGMESNYATTNINEDHSLWKRIWSITGPPKMKHFLWRACKGSLPVNVERHRRHWTENPICSRCNSAEETVIHALLKCPTTAVVWSTHPSMPLLNQAPTSSFNACLDWLWSHATKDELADALSLMWASWFVRNKQVMSSENVDAVSITIDFSNLIRDYEKYARKVYQAHLSRSPMLMG